MMLSLLFSLLSGALLPLAFAPFKIYSLAFLMPAVLLFIWLRNTPKQAFVTGWLFGLGLFGVGVSWVYISIHRFGGAPVWLAIALTALFVMILACYPATLGYFFRKFFARFSVWLQCLIAFPVLWLVWECLRSFLFSGLPWLLLGYPQLHTPMQGLAPIIGVYGLSFFAALINGALVVLVTHQTNTIKFIALFSIFAPIAVGAALEGHAWTSPVGKPIKTALMQGNIPQEIKWDANYLAQNINVYKHLTFKHWDNQLIVWPEGALPIVTQNIPTLMRQLTQTAKQHHTNIILGTPIENQTKNTYYNGILLLGENNGQYLKRHLVPFGEYTPISSVFTPILRYFHIPMSDFSPGPADQPDFKLGEIQIAPFLCYEIIFEGEVLKAAQHSNMLVTLADDSWFGQSLAMPQQLEMARMRSLETGQPQLISTNTGITAFISPLGKIQETAPINQRTVITAEIQPMQGKTPLIKLFSNLL